ncbi:BRCA2 and CDKN1A-interacting protein isoform X7 [Oryctolagus cuniculus]|uniref:BRCA2 and CDKN1A-interacting protein isoform X7 n=1 Tax=Oryctolagus cuniculus TaxID=9986 RepID=UPI00387A58C5
MASRSKRRAVGNGVPRPPGAPVQRHEQEEEDEVEDEDEDEEDSDEEEDEDDEIVDEQTDISEDSDDDMDEDEIFGFISLLNLTERKGTPCAEQIKELVLSCCEKSCEKSVVEQLDALLQDASKPVGFLLSERLMNVPPQVALPMHQQLQKELAEAHKTSKPCGKCCFYLLISKTFVEAGKGSSKKKRSSQKKEELMFANAEEEFFYELAAPGTSPHTAPRGRRRKAAGRLAVTGHCVSAVLPGTLRCEVDVSPARGRGP